MNQFCLIFIILAFLSSSTLNDTKKLTISSYLKYTKSSECCRLGKQKFDKHKFITLKQINEAGTMQNICRLPSDQFLRIPKNLNLPSHLKFLDKKWQQCRKSYSYCCQRELRVITCRLAAVKSNDQSVNKCELVGTSRDPILANTQTLCCMCCLMFKASELTWEKLFSKSICNTILDCSYKKLKVPKNVKKIRSTNSVIKTYVNRSIQDDIKKAKKLSNNTCSNEKYKNRFVWNDNLQNCIVISGHCPHRFYFNKYTEKCELIPNNFQLNCKKGYRIDYLTRRCVDLNECKGETQENYFIRLPPAVRPNRVCNLQTENCINTNGSFRCDCKSGFVEKYEKSGLKFCQDIDECKIYKEVCQPGMACKNTFGSYLCKRVAPCGYGYEIDEKTQKCVDINECLKKDICDNVTKCINVIGGFKCVTKTCPVGKILNRKTGECIPCTNGYVFNRKTRMCTDLNECRTPNICPPNQYCQNTRGSYRCKSCDPGFEYNSNTGTCKEISECGNGRICAHGKVCRNFLGTYRCKCPENLKFNIQKNRCACNYGYRWNPNWNQCVDIDECKINVNASCNRPNEICKNNPGSFMCICKPGFERKGKDCIDINECLIKGTSGTSKYCTNGKCKNSWGNFSCQCPDNYQYNYNEAMCIDKNECNSKNICQSDNESCLNVHGSYRCIKMECDPYLKLSNTFINPFGFSCVSNSSKEEIFTEKQYFFVELFKPLQKLTNNEKIYFINTQIKNIEKPNFSITYVPIIKEILPKDHFKIKRLEEFMFALTVEKLERLFISTELNLIINGTVQTGKFNQKKISQFIWNFKFIFTIYPIIS